jgi:hypothetical protein
MRAGLLLELEEELSELGVVLDHAICEGVHDPSQHREGDPAAGHDDACGSPLDSSNRRRGDTLRGDRRAQRRWPPAPAQFGRDGVAAKEGANCSTSRVYEQLGWNRALTGMLRAEGVQSVFSSGRDRSRSARRALELDDIAVEGDGV